MRQVSEVKSTMVVSRYGIIIICTPSFKHEGPRKAQGFKMMNMAHLLATAVELTSETWYELVNDGCGDSVVLFRSIIHADLAEISHMCHFVPPG